MKVIKVFLVLLFTAAMIMNISALNNNAMSQQDLATQFQQNLAKFQKTQLVYLNNSERTYLMTGYNQEMWTNSTWNIMEMDSIFYNNQGKISEVKVYDSDGNGGYDILKTVYTYTNGKVTKAEMFQYDEGAWILFTTMNVNYNNAGNLLNFVVSMTYGPMTIPLQRMSFVYGGNGMAEYFCLALFDYSTQSWMYQKATFAYDGQGRPNMTTNTESADSLSWANAERESSTYMAFDNTTYTDVQNYYNTAFVFSMSIDGTYTEFIHFSGTLTQNWDGSAWFDASRETYTYNNDQEITNMLTEIWTTTWTNSENDIYTYNTNGKLDMHKHQTWNGSAWVDNERWVYFYGEVNANEDNAINAPSISISNYPNPFQNNTNISISSKSPLNTSLTIYNIKGEVIKNMDRINLKQGTNSFSWNSTDNHGNKVPSGIYFLKLNNGANTKAVKMLIMK